MGYLDIQQVILSTQGEENKVDRGSERGGGRVVFLLLLLVWFLARRLVDYSIIALTND
jgi:hypothetical protein